MGGRRVCITGIGVITPIGIGPRDFWEAVGRKVCGIGPVLHFDASACSSRIAAVVKGFDPTRHIHPKKVERMGRATQFSIVAAKQALADAGIDLSREDPDRWMIVTGTSNADCEPLSALNRAMFSDGMAAVDPTGAPPALQSATACSTAVELRFHGESQTISTGCTSGLNAIGHAFRQVRSGVADAAMAGGVEAPVIPLILSILSNGNALSCRNDDPIHASRPFDRNRDGYILAEGAAFFVLEEAARAESRGARVYAEIAGFGATNDAFSHLRLYEGHEHMARAMTKAMADARVLPEQIDYISAHGSSSVVADRRETRAIKTALGPRAEEIPVSSIKSLIGQAIGAGGALQTAVTALSLFHGAIHPTVNLEEPDPECDLDYVAGEMRESVSKAALVNSMGMGGTNACLVLVKAGFGSPARDRVAVPVRAIGALAEAVP